MEVFSGVPCRDHLCYFCPVGAGAASSIEGGIFVGGRGLAKRNWVYRTSVVHRHHVHLVKRTGAGWAFPHAVADTIVHAFVAEQVAAGLQSCILEVVAADRAQSKSSEHFFLL